MVVWWREPGRGASADGAGLDPREWLVLALLATGLPLATVAAALRETPAAIERCRDRALAKLAAPHP
jgi:DNA-binding NarL/FixJ family response regulator